jgi:hypothetical protein
MSVIVAGSPDCPRPLGGRIAAIGRSIADCIAVMAACSAAAGRYGELSRLTDAELRRRGLSRTTLARDVLEACCSQGPIRSR